MIKFNTSNETIENIISDYIYNNYTQKKLSEIYNISQGKISNILRQNNVQANNKWRRKLTQEEKERISQRLKGRDFSEKTRKLISEANKCHFNGLNGYGHLHKHSNGYIQAFASEHPKADKTSGRVMLHTIIMERQLGRYLFDDEVVHHINHNRADNRIENLQLMKKKDHMSMHMKERHAENRKRR